MSVNRESAAFRDYEANMPYNEFVKKHGTVQEAASRAMSTRVVDDPRLNSFSLEVAWLREDVAMLRRELAELKERAGAAV